MIGEINKEALEKLGFEPKRAEELGKEGISTKTIIGDNHIVIDGRTNIVYSDTDGARKYYFENGALKFPAKCDSLREEYYNLKLKLYLNENKATGLTDSDLAKEFHNAEIQHTENEIATTKDKFKTYSKNPEFTKIKNRYLNWLKSKQLKANNAETKQPVNTDEVKQQHPKHNPNLWNNDCFELFKYLFDEYYKGTKRELTNIWFYLKGAKSSRYLLKATKDDYKIFIREFYSIEIKNFDKAQTKWEEKECSSINEHRIYFEDTLKQIAENAKNT